MPIVAFRALHPASTAALLNEEWLVLENVSDKPFSIAGCSVGTARGKSARPRGLGTIDPGLTILPGEKVRLVTGTPGKKAQGVPPEDAAVKTYHLFLGGPVLKGAGTIVVLTLGQHELARAVFDPGAKDGIAPTKNGHG
jgi:hypothetical protein